MPDDPKKGAKQQQRHMHVKASEEKLQGNYSNHMIVAHSKEEFYLDFMVMLPNMGSLVSRVIVSPGHMKRILRALNENIGRYEKKYGTIDESAEPPAVPSTPTPESIN